MSDVTTKFEVTEYRLTGSDKEHPSFAVYVRRVKGGWIISPANKQEAWNRSTKNFNFVPFNSSMSKVWIRQHRYAKLELAMAEAERIFNGEYES